MKRFILTLLSILTLFTFSQAQEIDFINGKVRNKLSFSPVAPWPQYSSRFPDKLGDLYFNALDSFFYYNNGKEKVKVGGGVDAYSKTEIPAVIGEQIRDSLNNLSINISEATDSKTDEDSVLVIDNGEIEYITRTNLFNLDWQRYVKYDTTTSLSGTLTSAITTTATLSNLGYMYAWPIMFPKDVIIDKIYTETTSSIANSVYVIAVYADNGSTYPGSKLFNSIEFSGAATSLKYQLLVTPIAFHKNTLYWLVYEPNVAAPVLRALAGNAIIGVLNFVPGLTGQVTGYLRASEYNTTLPTTFPNGAIYMTNQPIPLTLFQEQ